MIATPETPFLFIFEGVIPALKNNRQEDHRPSVEVNNWYKGQRERLLAQRAMQSQLDDISIAYCRLEYFAKDALPNGDLDNVYTTVQELLQPPSAPTVVRKQKGILGLIKNDKLVRGGSFCSLPLSEQQPVSGAYLWVWEYDLTLSDIKQLNRFETAREQILALRLNKPTILGRFRKSLANN